MVLLSYRMRSFHQNSRDESHKCVSECEDISYLETMLFCHLVAAKEKGVFLQSSCLKANNWTPGGRRLTEKGPFTGMSSPLWHIFSENSTRKWRQKNRNAVPSTTQVLYVRLDWQQKMFQALRSKTWNWTTKWQRIETNHWKLQIFSVSPRNDPAGLLFKFPGSGAASSLLNLNTDVCSKDVGRSRRGTCSDTHTHTHTYLHDIFLT